MNKYGWLFVLSLISILITLVVNEVDNMTLSDYNVTGGVTEGVNPEDDVFSIEGASTFFESYLDLLTFNVEGIGPIISLLFLPAQLVIGVILGEIIIKIVEAIIPF